MVGGSANGTDLAFMHRVKRITRVYNARLGTPAICQWTTMSRIIATIISDNRETVIGGAIQSIAGWVDHVVLVDTGITDGTRRVAESLLGERLSVESLAWKNDFAAARNFAVEAAARRGAAWALTLDTDERLCFFGFKTSAELRLRLNHNPRIRAWLVLAQDGSYSKERFIRVSGEQPPLTWMGRTHEYLAGASQSERATLPGVTVSEIRKTPDQFRSKVLRDLAVLDEETRARPQEPRWWYYLGQTYEGLGRPAEAADAYRRCAAVRQGWSEQAAWACYRAANCHLQLAQPEEALELCTSGLARQPESPELAWLAGFICYRLRRFRQAVTWSQLSITLGNFRGHQSGQWRISFRYLPAWYEGPFDVLRYAYRELGQPALAAECHRDFLAAKKLREDLSGSLSGQATCDSCDATSSWGPDDQSQADAGRVGRNVAASNASVAARPAAGVLRVAVLGLYSSGSTATAAVLHRLGIKLGRNVSAEYHYEPKWLSAELRRWWREPALEEAASRHDRVQTLAAWLADQQRWDNVPVGAKHPLLTLCGPDLVEAWGEETKFVWTWRPLEESIASLKRRGWWPGREVAIQRRLWAAAEEFFSTQAHLRVPFADMLRDPQREVERLVEFLGLPVSAAQCRAAATAVRQRQPPVSTRRVLFDLGAHYGEGLRKLRTLLSLDDTWEIHAFEPNPHCDTTKHLAELGLRAAVHRQAVWIRDGQVAFCAQDRRRCVSPAPTEGSSEYDGWGSRIAEITSCAPGLTDSIEVPCLDFSRLLAERGPDDYIVVKMDVEGAEFAILRRLVEQGTIRRIRQLYVEWHHRQLAAESESTRDQLEGQVRDAGVDVVRWS